MRVAVKNMSGVFIHSTTPRKARLLLKEKKAVIESNNPFTIRLLFSESECGLKDSFLQQNKSDNNKSENENTMCDEKTLLAVERRDCMEFNYEIKVFYVQYNVSFLVSEIPLDSVVSEEDAIKEGKKYRDIYDELLTKDRSYLSMPDTEVKLLIIKRHRDGGLPITIGYLGIFKGYGRCPDMGSSEFEMDRIDEFYKDYK